MGSTRTQRGRVLRRSIVLGGVSLGSLAAVAPVADAASNFGGQYTSRNSYGGRSAIATPPNATTETVDSGEFVLHRVAAQGNSANAVGLIQTGLYRSGPYLHLDLCDTSVDKYTWYVEILPADGNYNYKCGVYGQAPFGHDVEYKVTGDGTGRWQAGGADIQSGQSYATPWVPLQFTAGFQYISTELQSGSFTVVADRSTTNAVYGGGSGPEPSWYEYQSPGYGSPHLVGPSETTEIPHRNPGTGGSTGTWYVPDAPTPVRFKHAP